MIQDTRELSRKIARFAGWKEEAGWWYFPGANNLPQGDAPDFAGSVDTCIAFLTDVLAYICLAWLKPEDLWVATVFQLGEDPVTMAYDKSPSMAICLAVEKIIDRRAISHGRLVSKE